MEFSVALVDQLFGNDKADSVKEPLVMRSNPGDEYTIAELHTVEWVSDDPPKVLVPIANGSEEMETISIVDVLRRAKAEVIVASVEDTKETVGSRKLKIVADMLLNEASKLSYDLIVLPGGLPGAQKFASSETLVEMLNKQKSSKKTYGSICASPALVMEPHGFLRYHDAKVFSGFVSLHWTRLNIMLTQKSHPKFAEVASLEFLMFPRDDKVCGQYARKIVISCYFDMKD